jgi:hypothetical protein
VKKSSHDKPNTPLTLKVNTILEGQFGVGRFIKAGDPLPFSSLEEMPAALRPFVGEPENLPPPPTDMYDWAPDPFAKDPPGIKEMMERNSAAMVAEAEMRNEVASNIVQQERETLKTRLAARLNEQDKS